MTRRLDTDDRALRRDAVKIMRAARAEAGLPPRVEDPATLSKVATMVLSALRSPVRHRAPEDGAE